MSEIKDVLKKVEFIKKELDKQDRLVSKAQVKIKEYQDKYQKSREKSLKLAEGYQSKLAKLEEEFKTKAEGFNKDITKQHESITTAVKKKIEYEASLRLFNELLRKWGEDVEDIPESPAMPPKTTMKAV